MQGAPSGGPSSVQQSSGQSRTSAAGPASSASDDLAAVRMRVALLERELADSEHTHQLRSACHVQWQHCAASAAVVAVAVFGSMH